MMFNVLMPEFIDKDYNILDFGAIEGGLANCGEAINKAIMEAHNNGGGRVIIPTGLYLTSPIELLSNVNLHLEDGAYVVFNKNEHDYPVIESDWEGIKRLRAKSPIMAKNQKNIAITGKGILDGSGHLWRGIKKWKLTEKEWQKRLSISPYVLKLKETEIWYPTKSSYEGVLQGETTDIIKAQEYYDFYRPAFVNIVNCDVVLFDGVTFQNSPAWNIHPLFTNNLTIQNCKIRNPYHAQNGDGLDVESCKNVHIHHCDFEVGDDGICIKSGKNKEARLIKVPCENVYIHHCNVFEAHGGFVVGSEMSRGVKNVYVEDCNFIGTDVGIRFKSSMGRGGVVEKIHIKNIKMTDIKEEAIIFTMGYALTTLGVEGVEKLVNESMEDVPEFKDIDISNCVCTNSKKGIVVEGLPQLPIRDIKISNTRIFAELDMKISNAKNIILENTSINNTLYNKNVGDVL